MCKSKRCSILRPPALKKAVRFQGPSSSPRSASQTRRRKTAAPQPSRATPDGPPRSPRQKSTAAWSTESVSPVGRHSTPLPTLGLAPPLYPLNRPSPPRTLSYIFRRSTTVGPDSMPPSGVEGTRPAFLDRAARSRTRGPSPPRPSPPPITLSSTQCSATSRAVPRGPSCRKASPRRPIPPHAMPAEGGHRRLSTPPLSLYESAGALRPLTPQGRWWTEAGPLPIARATDSLIVITGVVLHLSCRTHSCRPRLVAGRRHARRIKEVAGTRPNPLTWCVVGEPPDALLGNDRGTRSNSTF